MFYDGTIDNRPDYYISGEMQRKVHMFWELRKRVKIANSSPVWWCACSIPHKAKVLWYEMQLYGRNHYKK
jgi:hypothetical protein